MARLKISPYSVQQAAKLSSRKFSPLPEGEPFDDVNAPDTDHDALFNRFLRYKRRQTLMSVLIFAVGGIIYWLFTRFLSDPLHFEWFILFLVLISLTVCRYLTLKYRIRKRWFANNEYEAAELVQFVRQQ
ncbi:MAG: hypothetical protein ACREEM_02900 [Blastocatellia bacterium]